MENSIFKAINSATKLIIESNTNVKEIGISFHYGDNSIVLHPRQLGYQQIIELLKSEYNYDGYSDIHENSNVIDLTNEEYYIKNGNFRILNTWGKISIRLKEYGFEEDGTYVIQHENQLVEIELYNSYRWNKDSSLEPRKSYSGNESDKLKEFTNIGKAKELRIYYIPPYHMWKRVDWETYPDDCGCGIYSTSIDVFDKATGVPYNT